MTTATPDYIPGLQGVVAAETRLSSVDGQLGELIIAGFPLEEIAENATFEEMTYLLWYDTLPDRQQLADFRARLAAYRALPGHTLDLLRAAAEQQADFMDALRMAASTISLRTPDEPDDEYRDALALVARFPLIVAAYWRLVNKQEPLPPRTDLSHAANYLYLLNGTEPGVEQTRALETYLNTVVDHGLNASTFTARVIISTQSDMVSAVAGAVGALKGPLHGGAPGPALDMVFEIGDAANTEPYIRAKLERGERLMVFGHRVYKVRDPRADVLGRAAEILYQTGGDSKLYALARHVEQVAVALLEEYKPGRNLQTNVEFYTALLLHGLGLPTALFSPTFAISRVVGWIAHAFEQQAAGRIIRPQSVYTGTRNRRWVPLERR
ncbi:MAG TPA: citrate synthase/methylcitrate synthase [Spirillospora sp.]|nr:citrate synthase/methylcitrate synthase [Spirillospora sp.]